MARITVDKIKGLFNFKPKNNTVELPLKSNFIESGQWQGSFYGNMIPFNGEKTPLELGTPLDYIVDYYSMRKRALEAFLTNDVIQNAIEKYIMWAVGTGLKIQAEPIESIIRDNQIVYADLIKSIEDNFRLFANSNFSTYKQNQNLHKEAEDVFKNAKLAGDCLCILRYENSQITVQTIDGCYVSTPATEYANKNIINGVELDDNGIQIAYYVQTDFQTWKRVEARNSNGQLVAWLVYGRKYKLNDVRGLSLLSAVLETASKLDRYKDATVGAAEENSKIPYTIEHGTQSTGDNPMLNQLAQSLGKGNGQAPETLTIQTDTLASKIAQTTSKQTYNMPIDSKLVRHDASVDINFKDFFMVNIDIVYATLSIPAEVALDKFEGSYSSSRAALKSWEYNLNVNRNNILKNQFYKHIYDFWLDIQVAKGVFKLPGYFNAFKQRDTMQLEAYRNCRFIGSTVPHIDPLKEVMAERKKLGTSFDNVPLTTHEQACENLNTGDSTQVINKATNEKIISKYFDVSVDNGSSTTEVPGKPS